MGVAIGGVKTKIPVYIEKNVIRPSKSNGRIWTFHLNRSRSPPRADTAAAIAFSCVSIERQTEHNCEEQT